MNPSVINLWAEDFKQNKSKVLAGDSVCTRVFLASTSDSRNAECCLTAVRTDHLRRQEKVMKWCKIQQHTNTAQQQTEAGTEILFYLFSCFRFSILLFVSETKKGNKQTEESLKWFIQHILLNESHSLENWFIWRAVKSVYKDRRRTSCPLADLNLASFSALLRRTKKKCKYLDLHLWNLVYRELVVSWCRYWYQYQIAAVLAQNTLIQIPVCGTFF